MKANSHAYFIHMRTTHHLSDQLLPACSLCFTLSLSPQSVFTSLLPSCFIIAGPIFLTVSSSYIHSPAHLPPHPAYAPSPSAPPHRVASLPGSSHTHLPNPKHIQIHPRFSFLLASTDSSRTCVPPSLPSSHLQVALNKGRS